ncbi:ATP-binding cassette domain-containing protein, partial [candidate division KSB1 bacterium]|nr:ATP-binding cassette domain-containing protein [candidate division KSB1 bacterium]
TIWGEKIWNNHRLTRRIGYCPETDAFYNHLTGYEYLFHLLRLHGFTKSEASEKAVQALQTVEMEPARNKKIGSYSKGMQQRIKLAQAFAHDPELLLLDEPLLGMDPLGRHKTISLINEWGNSGKTIIVSSHILHEVEEMTDTILLMNRGNIIAEGNIYEIRRLIDEHPLHVTIGCDKTHQLTSKLLEYDDVISVQFDRERGEVTVQTTKPDAFYQRLPGMVLENDIEIFTIMSPDENLRAVFEYLVR